VDRMIIAQSISTGYPLISADHIFPHYVVHGLDLIVN
jgi:PIN domain nuclease of toxin-antitoxin system